MHEHSVVGVDIDREIREPGGVGRHVNVELVVDNHAQCQPYQLVGEVLAGESTHPATARPGPSAVTMS